MSVFVDIQIPSAKVNYLTEEAHERNICPNINKAMKF